MASHPDETTMDAHVRDFRGYGQFPPRIRWPNDAGLAVNFVLNVEEGAEYSILDGDAEGERALTEVRSPRVPIDQRDLAAESMYEYGSRVGFWRIYRAFCERRLPVTVFASGQALERNPDIASAIRDTDWDICAHGWRWIEHYKLTRDLERDHIARAFDAIKSTVGRAPLGWYCRYAPSSWTRELVVDHGGFLYDSDAYNDEIPYWLEISGKRHLVVPYTLTTNDAKFLSGDTFSADQFYTFLRDSAEVLLSESAAFPRMMSVGMHPRIIAHPGRFSALIRFLDALSEMRGVWVCRRSDIARHWMEVTA